MKQSLSDSEPINKSDQEISFISNREYLTKDSETCPVSTAKTMPKWYKDADIFAIDPNTQKPWINPQDGGKVPTWKACPAILDAMSTGYVLRTSCDIEFYYDNSRISARVLDNNCGDFVHKRDPMPQFTAPMGYDENHFAWMIDWGTKLPEGYSALYTQPLNRFDLPFLSTSGIVDNDKVNMPGSLPFFVFKGWTGIVPAGTPYSQVIPFKREDWVSEIKIENPKILAKKNYLNWSKYRVKDGGIYKNKIWQRRYYK
jgi:hypothetical protein